MDRTKPTTQLLGRFQPWHRGHTELFERAIEHTGQVVIMLRETEESETDPLTFEERKAIIIRHLAERGYEHKIFYELISVPNITHITYGRNVGYKIEKEELGEELEKISGTEERTTFSTLRDYWTRGGRHHP